MIAQRADERNPGQYDHAYVVKTEGAEITGLHNAFQSGNVVGPRDLSPDFLDDFNHSYVVGYM